MSIKTLEKNIEILWFEATSLGCMALHDLYRIDCNFWRIEALYRTAATADRNLTLVITWCMQDQRSPALKMDVHFHRHIELFLSAKWTHVPGKKRLSVATVDRADAPTISVTHDSEASPIVLLLLGYAPWTLSLSR